MTATQVSTGWVVKSKQLKFSVAGFMVCAFRIKTAVLDGAFAELSDDPDETTLPLDTMPADVAGALVLGQPIREKLPILSLRRGFIRYVPYQYRRFHTDFNGSFADYLNRFSHKRRSLLRRRVKRFQRAGDGEIWREYITPQQMQRFHTLAKEISRKTYQENMAHAGLHDTPVFINEMMDRAARNAVRGYLLFLEKQPVAFQYCLVEGDIMLYERAGYDPEHRCLGPGTTLLYLLIEHLFNSRQLHRLDFGPGEAEYKELFGTAYRDCADIYYLRRTLKNMVLVGAHALMTIVLRVLREAVNRAGIYTRLRNFVRTKYGQR